MRENYCGRCCDGCEYLEKQLCPGCEAGPGNKKEEICRLADCCRTKMNSSCASCPSCEGCQKLAQHNEVPTYIISRLRRNKAMQERINELTAHTGKWQMMFFLAIGTALFNFLYTLSSVFVIMNTNGTPDKPLLSIIFGVLAAVCGAVYGCILISMNSLNSGYTIAGLAILGGNVLSLVSVLSSFDDIVLLLLISIISTILTILAAYKEYNSHSELLDGLHDELSKSWRTLWVWYVVVYIADLVIGSALGIIMMLALLAVGVLRFVNLYKTTVLLEQLSD